MPEDINISETNMIELMTYSSDIDRYKHELHKIQRRLQEVDGLMTAAKARFWGRAEELYPALVGLKVQFNVSEQKFEILSDKKPGGLLAGTGVQPPLKPGPEAHKQCWLLYNATMEMFEGKRPRKIEVLDDAPEELKLAVEAFNDMLEKII